MVALLDDITVLHDKNQICIADRGKPMRDHKARTAFHQRIHCFLDLDFRTGIDRGGRLVQNQNAVICQNRTRDREQLLLAL